MARTHGELELRIKQSFWQLYPGKTPLDADFDDLWLEHVFWFSHGDGDRGAHAERWAKISVEERRRLKEWALKMTW